MTKAVIELTAADKTKAAIDSAKRGLKSLGDTAGALPGRFGSLGTALAAAFTAVTFKGGIDVLDQLDDLSEKTGISVNALSALRYAGEVVGTPLEAIATSTKKLAMNMTEAAAGNKEAAATFKAVGIEVKNADGSLKSQDQVLLELADRFAGYSDGAGKAALAQKIFGKAGQDMIPLLNQGSAGIKALRGEAEALGLVYGGDLAKQGAEFNDNLKKLELAAEAAKVSLLGGILPTLNELLRTFIALKQEGVVWDVIADKIAGLTQHIPGLAQVAKLAQSLGLAREGGQLTGAPGEDINRLLARRAELQQEAQSLEARPRSSGRRGEAEAAWNAAAQRRLSKEIGDVDGLLTAARVLQAREAMRGVDGADTGDALSRRLRQGTKTAAPIVPGEGKDKAAKERERELKEQAKLLNDLSGLTGTFHEDWDRLTRLYKAGTINMDQLVASQQKLLSQQPFMAERAKVEKELADTRVRAAELSDKALGRMVEENAELAKSNLTLGEQIEMIGLTAEQMKALTLARMEANIARERENLLAAQNIEGNEAEVAQIERRIHLLERQKELTGQKFDREATADFTEGLRDDTKAALRDAFKAGGGFGETFAQGIANTLRNRVTDALADSFIDALMGKKGGGGGILSGILNGKSDAVGDMLSSAGSSVMGFFSSVFSGLGFAGGGRPPVGKASWVGERGRELFVPDGPGTIIPNHQLGAAAGGITIVNNMTVGDVASSQQVQEQIRLAQNRTIQSLQRSNKYRTV